jgi:hypothetical protein
MLLSDMVLAISWLSGVPAVPVFVIPAKMRSVVEALVGAPPVQFAPVLQLTPPPLPFQVEVAAWAEIVQNAKQARAEGRRSAVQSL